MTTQEMPESRTLAHEDGTAQFEGFDPVRHSTADVWKCRVCGYTPNIDKVSPQCIGCGRDFWGVPGTRPEEADLIQHSRESGFS
jgi:rubrerythrin